MHMEANELVVRLAMFAVAFVLFVIFIRWMDK